MFSSFVQLLKNGSQIAVTPNNVGYLSLLADEFCRADLQRDYKAASHEFVAKLGERVRELEKDMSLSSTGVPLCGSSWWQDSSISPFWRDLGPFCGSPLKVVQPTTVFSGTKWQLYLRWV
jgi:hypothetical protein